MIAQKSEKLKKALLIIWICFFIMVAQVLLDMPMLLKESPSSAASIFVTCLLIGTLAGQALLIWLIGRGKNWARWVFLIWSVTGMALSLNDLPKQIVTRPWALGFSTVVSIIGFVGLAMLFQTGADEYFRKPVSTPPQDAV